MDSLSERRFGGNIGGVERFLWASSERVEDGWNSPQRRARQERSGAGLGIAEDKDLGWGLHPGPSQVRPQGSVHVWISHCE